MRCVTCLSGARHITAHIKKAGLSDGRVPSGTSHRLTTRDPARYFKTSYGAVSTDGTLSRGPKFCDACCPLPGECIYQNKEWERWPESSRVTYHDRVEKNAKANKPPLVVGVRPDIKDLRHRRAVPLIVGTTSNGAALTWSQSQTDHPLTGVGERLVLHGFWTRLDAAGLAQWHFTETPKRKARRVRPSFREGWKPDLRPKTSPHGVDRQDSTE